MTNPASPTETSPRGAPPDRPALLRREVGLLRGHCGRGRFPSVLHLGLLGGRQHPVTLDPADVPLLDPGARADLVGRLLDGWTGADPPVLWLTRPGAPDLEDDDLAWSAAADRAFAARGDAAPSCYVVTPTGWADVRTGEGRRWKRLRM